MGIRNVIVEGPDGSGKSTLIRKLSEATRVDVAERASRSESGPVVSLYNWFMKDLDRISRSDHIASIYDRHPLISEPIYAPIARRVEPQPPFNEPPWLELNRRLMAHKAVLVLCIPPLWVVKTNVKRTAQMPGVVDHITKIWEAYDVFYRQDRWPANRVIRYDYTNHDTAPFLKLRIMSILKGANRA